LVMRVHTEGFRDLPVLSNRVGSLGAVAERRGIVRAVHEPRAQFALDMLTASDRLLGRDSPHRVALLTRARALAGGPSIRQICREGYGWRRPRSELYRLSNAAAAMLADDLNRRGVPVPDSLSVALHAPMCASLTKSRCRSDL
jgi:hypothetical protein